MTDGLPLRRTVVVLSAVIYWGGVWVQARRVRKQIGRSPNLKPRTVKERLLWLGWFLVIIGWLGQSLLVRRDSGLLVFEPVNGLMNPYPLVAGLVLIVAGYLCTLWCYKAMGNAWRIGINPKEKNFLVTGGPYSAIRHPIYFFQIVMLAGVVLLLPTVCSVIILVMHIVCVWIKSSDEEAYLRGVHGKEWEEYVGRTGRLIPKFGGGRL